MNLFRYGIFVALAIGAAVPVGAKQIPIEVYWSGQAPSEVVVNVPGGFRPLQAASSEHVFRGSISISSSSPERKTVTVRYGSYNHPFDFRVHPSLARVAFSIEHRIQASCTATRVQQVSAPSDNLPDAVSRSVAAGELISISEPNACDRDLRFSAVQAQYRQNAKMAELSNGFFLINRDIEQQYREEARNRGIYVSAEIAEYDNRDQELEARQLVVFQAAAAAAGNYDLALQTNAFISARVSTDAKTAAFYKHQGVTRSSLVAVSKRLAAAKEQSTRAMGATRPDDNHPDSSHPPPQPK